MRETLLKTLKEVAASVIDPGVRPTAKPTFMSGPGHGRGGSVSQ
jgi:hypothetical protein